LEGATDERTVSRRTRERIAWALAGIGASTCAVLAAALLLDTDPANVPLHFQVFPASGSAITAGLPEEGGSPLAVSPDGTRIVFVATTADGANALWLRPLSAMTAQIIPGTEGASSPFWKPDGSAIGFFADRKLKRISISGGPVQTLCDAPANRNGAWGSNGVIVFSPTNASPLHKVSEDSGIDAPFTKLEDNEVGHLRPVFLPDGKHFLYTAYFTGQTTDVPIYLASLDAPQRKLLLKGDTANVAYASGHVLFMRETTLMAQPFDEQQLELDGEPFPVVENVRSAMTPGFGVFSVSMNGVLAYQTGSGGYNATRVRWVDRTGKELEQVGGLGDYVDLDLSPDGKFAAITSLEPGQRSTDIWIYDLSQRNKRTRLTSNPFTDFAPVWSSSGTADFVYFGSRSTDPAATGIYRQQFNGGAHELVRERGVPRSVSPDGKHLLFTQVTPGKGNDLFAFSLSGQGPVISFADTPASEAFGQFSPDGKWIAYETNEQQQRMEVFVAPFPPTGAKWLVSIAGGGFPRWRNDGKEIFFISSGKLMAAAVTPTAAGLRVSEPKSLFDFRSGRSGYPYAVSGDGKRFLITSFDQAMLEPISVVTNWLAMRAH
jgi:eukaryotic-like serine/threonine-protein kinase